VWPIHKYIANFGYSFKRVSRVASVSLTNELRERRIRYATWFLKLHNSNRNVMFYDETEFQVVMRNTYGRLSKEKNAICPVPSIKSRNITVMSMEGLVSYKVLERPCNKTQLLAYLQRLIQVLSGLGLSNVVIIMDNATFHKSADIKKPTNKYMSWIGVPATIQSFLQSNWKHVLTVEENC